ncbi:hypothetical protein KKA14_15565, partial [bacterium]|nr:hypothetical protein [bacterium]
LLLLYQERAYQSAELRNAEYEVRMTRIREIGLGCFSMAGSVTRIVFGDYASIVTLFIQAKDLFLWAKQSFSQNTDTLYDTYWELDEALNALARSVDEGRIQANISRVEKAYVPYLKITSKFTQASIDNIVDIQQFFQHIDDIEAALETLKREHPVNAQKAKSFTDLKIKLSALKRSSDQVNAVANSIKEALTATDTIRVRKNTLVTKKGMELKTLETIRKSNKLSKAKGFASIINISLPLVENIASTIGQILQ